MPFPVFCSLVRCRTKVRHVVVLGGWLLATVAGAGQSPQPAAAVAPVQTVTSIRQFWALPPEQKAKPVRFEFECDITYYDPGWNALWIQDATGAAYVHRGDAPFPLRSGQHVRASGEMAPPNIDVNFDHAVFEVLSPATIAPIEIGRKILETEQFRDRRVVVEAVIDAQETFDPTHVHLTLAIEGQTAFAWVLKDPATPVPHLAGMVARLTGVYNPKVSSFGSLSSLELMVARLEDVVVLYPLASDPRFELRVATLESLPRRPPDTLVHVVGRVRAFEPGRYVRIRDDTGQVDVLSGQTRPVALNERIEAVGYPAITGTDWKLANAVFRSPPTPGAVGTVAPPVLRVAAQVLELAPEEAAASHAAVISGVVTWSHPEAPFYFIQDASGGVCVQRDHDSGTLSATGRNVLVRGVTTMGPFAPAISASRSSKLGDLILPEARAISLEHAMTGREEAQWVEMQGYLRQVSRDGPWTKLSLTTAGGGFDALLPATPEMDKLVGAVVRVHGVCSAIANDHRQLTGIRLWVPADEFVQVEEAAPEDPFAVPRRAVASLGQFDSLQSFSHRARVTGTVLYHEPGRALQLAEDGEGLLVLSRGTAPLQPGDLVEAVGFPGRQGSRVVLREAVYRKTGHGREPPALTADATRGSQPVLDGRLVRLEAALIESSSVRGRTRLTLQAGDTIFEAYLNSPVAGHPEAAWLDANRVALTGVYELKVKDDGTPGGFQLQLRTPADVVVLRRSSWFTRGRVLAIAGALLLGILAFTGWIVALRRQVTRQTRQIRDQLRRESHLESELQRATRLESLGLLAGGIAHDFNNLLTVVMGNLSLASLDEKIADDSSVCLREATKAVMRARDLTQQLLTFAKGGAPVRAAVMLPDVVREVAEFALHGSEVRCAFSIADDLWPADVDKGQIGQVVQNIVINARQAMPRGGHIDITLRNETVTAEGGVLRPGRFLRLTIADHGTGISAEDLPRVFEPYFTTKKQGNGLGLATVYSIVKKHHGHVSVDSAPGRGTTFTIWLPAAGEPVDTSADGPQGPTEPTARKRVLFMDDDPEIRRIGEAILQRLGHAVTAVSDGAEAVRVYAEALRSASPFDLVILDLTVPGGMGGRQAMEELRKIDPRVKAIVSSGYSNDQALAHYREHGFLGRVAKPYEMADLARTISAVLQGELV